MSRSVTFTYYPRAAVPVGTQGAVLDLPWDGPGGWAERFLLPHDVRASGPSKAELDAAKDGDALVLGVVRGTRAIANVLETHALGLDLDELDDDGIGRVLAALSPFEHVAWTTHKSGHPFVGGRTRLRIVLPLARPIPAALHGVAWDRLVALVGGGVDTTCKDGSRLFFCPSTWDPTRATCAAWRHEGAWWDPGELGTVAPAKGRPSSLDDVAGAGVIRLWLQKLRRTTVVNDQGVDLSALAKDVLAGRPYAPPGRRHDANLAVTMWLATKVGRGLPEGAFADAFGPSLAAMDAESSSEETDPAALALAYEGALSLVATDHAGREDAARAANARAMDAQLARADGPAYTDVEVAAMVARQGWDDPRTIDHAWIVQRDVSFWFLAWPGVYVGPYSRLEARPAACRWLARAAGRVMLNEPTERGVRRRGIEELVEDHGTPARAVVSDMAASFGRYDPTTERIHEATCPVRPALVPAYDEEIDCWIRVMTGRHAERVLDWMALAADVEKPICALYLGGTAGVGKTLLAHGLARLWTDAAPPKLKDVLANFNEDLARCPLVFADEQVPTVYGEDVTARLRELIGTTDHTLNRKYQAPAVLHGAIRLVLAANHPNLLQSKGVSTRQDLDALAQRFLYVEVQDEAAELVELVPQEVKDGWKDGGIAAHALWLRDNRKVRRGRRFWVEGVIDEMHRMLTNSADNWNGKVCEWITRYLTNPIPFDKAVGGLVRRDTGVLLVNEQAIVDGWGIAWPSTRLEPEVVKIGTALRAVSAKERPQYRLGGKRVRYRKVDVEQIMAWARHTGIGDEDAMRRSLGLPVDGDPDDRTTDDLSSVVPANAVAA